MIDFLESWIDDLTGVRKLSIPSARAAAEASLAGSALRQLRAQPHPLTRRRYTGRIGNGRRGYAGQTVLLPNRTLGRLIAARRGWAAVAHVDPFSVRSSRITYVAAAEISPYKHPAAVALGRLKAGCREKPSDAKARACRRNGRCLPRAGSRARGRPRSTGSTQVTAR